MWELQFQGEGEEGLTRQVSQLQLIGVLIELEHLENLGNDIEVTLALGSLLELGGSVTANVGALEEVACPLSEGSEDGVVLSLDGGSLAREGVWSIWSNGLSEWGLLICGEESIGGLVEHVDVELSLVLVDSHVGSVDSDDVSESVHDWQVLELGSIDHDIGVGSLGVEGWVNDLEGADESLRIHFVWESGIDNHTVEVAWLRRCQGSLGELDVLVLQWRMSWIWIILTLVEALAGDLDLLGVDFLADLAIL